MTAVNAQALFRRVIAYRRLFAVSGPQVKAHFRRRAGLEFRHDLIAVPGETGQQRIVFADFRAGQIDNGSASQLLIGVNRRLRQDVFAALVFQP